MNKIDLIKNGLMTAPLKLLSGFEETVKGVTDIVVWGDARVEEDLSLEDIKTWFHQVPNKYKKDLKYGVVIRLQPVAGIEYRIFQGIYNQKGKVTIARQVVTEKISDDLLTQFGGTDMIIFAENPKKVKQL